MPHLFVTSWFPSLLHMQLPQHWQQVYAVAFTGNPTLRLAQKSCQTLALLS